MRRALSLLCLLLAAGTASAAPNVLANTAHVATVLNAALANIYGAGVVDVSIFSDVTSTDDGLNPLTQAAHIAAAVDTTRTDFQAANLSNQVNHAPYAVLTSPFVGYSITVETANYVAMTANGVIYSWPDTATQPAGTPPPILASAVTFNGGSSFPGTEFTLTTPYLGQATTDGSNATMVMGAVYAAMRHDHPTWTWGDIKGALRQTATNWATGYSSSNFGYGTVSYSSATAIAGTSSIFLQPPLITAVQASPGQYQVQLTIYPFRSTRRHHEVVYAVPTSYTFPVKNEYTATDIANAVTGGAVLIFTGDTVSTTPSGGGVLTGLTIGASYNIIGFTTDNVGGYSRVETFSPVSLTPVKCL